MSEYSQINYFNAFKKIRNKLRKYSLVGVIQCCMEYLHAPVEDKLAYTQRQPWIVLLLIKWAIIDDYALSVGKENPTPNQVHELLQLTLDLGNKVRMPDQYEHFNLFFRAIAYQQFIYQHETSPLEIGRQLLYFEKIAHDSYIALTFEKLTKIKIHRFLELSFALFIRFSGKKEITISPAWFRSLLIDYSEDEIEKFLDALSLSLPNMRASLLRFEAEIKSGVEMPRSPAEYYEQSIFLQYPLIKFRDKEYACIEYHLLFRCIERHIYNRLRDNDANTFMTNFGPIFESYVERVICHTQLDYIDEKKISELFGKRKGIKLVDFILNEDNANVFIDAKAIEISYQGKVAHEIDEFRRWIKSSAIKAIEQGNSVVNELANLPQNEFFKAQPRNYLIVVTYGETYIGSGLTLMDTIGENAALEISSNIKGNIIIPFENMYFFTIQEFEMLAEAVHANKASLTEILDAITVADADPQTRKFDLFHHFTTLNIEAKGYSYLRERTIGAIQSMASKLLNAPSDEKITQNS